MQQLNRSNHPTTSRPLKVIQFGGGNFLRAFADAMIGQANQELDFNGNVAVVEYMGAQLATTINQQQGLYQLVIQGLVEGQPRRETRIIDSIALAVNPEQDFVKFLALAAEPQVRYIISNTTEAGIVFDGNDDQLIKPGKSFPAKLTQLLFARYQIFNRAVDKGMIILACELIEDNGAVLKEICLRYARLWQLGNDFIDWLNTSNYFCSTLVDRIVTGFPHGDQELLDSLPYADQLVTVAEPYYSWVITGAETIKDELIFNHPQFNVKLASDLAAYRQLKVRLLNAVHTALVPVAYLSGIDEVRLSLENPLLKRYIQQLINNEIIPTLAVPTKEAQAFEAEVLERFANPYIVHFLMSIALNSIAKFVARDLPIIEDYQQKYSQPPQTLAFALAALLVFYRGQRGNEPIALNDDSEVIQIFQRVWGDGELALSLQVQQLLANSRLWGKDLSTNLLLLKTVTQQVTQIFDKGITLALTEVLQ